MDNYCLFHRFFLLFGGIENRKLPELTIVSTETLLFLYASIWGLPPSLTLVFHQLAQSFPYREEVGVAYHFVV